VSARRIVKVQISLSTTEPRPQAFIYDEHREFSWLGDAPRDLIELMDGRAKAFFYAKLLPSGLISIEGDAAKQRW